MSTYDSLFAEEPEDDDISDNLKEQSLELKKLKEPVVTEPSEQEDDFYNTAPYEPLDFSEDLEESFNRNYPSIRRQVTMLEEELAIDSPRTKLRPSAIVAKPTSEKIKNMFTSLDGDDKTAFLTYRAYYGGGAYASPRFEIGNVVPEAGKGNKKSANEYAYEAFSKYKKSGSSDFNTKFKSGLGAVEGESLKLDQVTSVKALDGSVNNAIGPGQIVKSTRAGAYKKLGVSFADGERLLRTDSKFYDKVWNAVIDEKKSDVVRKMQVGTIPNSFSSLAFQKAMNDSISSYKPIPSAAIATQEDKSPYFSVEKKKEILDTYGKVSTKGIELPQSYSTLKGLSSGLASLASTSTSILGSLAQDQKSKRNAAEIEKNFYSNEKYFDNLKTGFLPKTIL